MIIYQSHFFYPYKLIDEYHKFKHSMQQFKTPIAKMEMDHN